MNSTELAQKIADLHKTKATLVLETKKLQTEISELEGEQRKDKVKVLNDTMGELASINENIKAYAVLYRSCTDQQMLNTIKKKYPSIYENIEKEHRP